MLEEQTCQLKKNSEKTRTLPIAGEPGYVRCQPDNLLLLTYVLQMRTKSMLLELGVDGFHCYPQMSPRHQQEPTKDPVILNALLHVCKTMHDSVK